MPDNSAVPDIIRSHFSKAGLAEFRAALSPERLESDQKKLSVLFNEAAKSPELKDALDWATEHGVEFIVDRNMGAAGMYHTGTGVLAVSDELFNPGMKGEAVATLAHEIRHAWQDWNGLLPTHASSFLGFYIRQSVLEADAEAHGMLAYQQWGLRQMLEMGEAEKAAGDNSITQQELDELREDVRLSQEDPAPILWRGFNDWFESGAAEAYGLMSASDVGKEMGLQGAFDIARDNPDIAEAEAPPEYDPYKFMREPRPNRGVDIRGERGLSPLGRGFKDDGNYFEEAPTGYIEQNILSPSLAVSFYKAGEPPHPVVASIMKAEKSYNPFRGFGG